MSFHQIRERVNLLLYSHKARVLRIGRVLNILVSFTAVGTLVYYYGLEHESETEEFLLGIIKGSFIFYVSHYLTRFIYDFKPIEFLRRTWFEGLIMFLLTLEGVSYTFFDALVLERIAVALGIETFSGISALFIQLYVLIVVVIGVGKGGAAIPRFKANPALVFIASFALIIIAGTGLLMLPEMTYPEGSMNFLDALFTSTSASCVTGLMLVDTPAFFTFKGQVVLLILIKLGGLNIIAFGSFLALAARFGLRVRQHDVIEDFVNKDSFLSAKGMIGKVVIWSSSIELIGAALMYFFWGDGVPFKSNGDRAFHSLFHSVSAFNNAGISIFSNGMHNEVVRDNYLIHWIVMVLIFVGALGMVALFDLFDLKNLRDRMNAPWKRISFMTKIALYFSVGLVIAGACLFYLLEYNNTLGDYNTFGKFTRAIFQSVTTRTAGFNTVDIGSIGVPGLFLLIIFMFIGSSSSSTGGGIKTSTFAIVSADVLSTIRGAANTELFKRTIPNVLKSRAYAVLLFFIVGDVVGIFLLSITESHILEMPDRGLLDLVFEEVSALGTVGLSTGITSLLSVPGKLIIIASMFIGRVGTLTVAFAVGVRLISKDYRYPEGHTMVG